jgi:hypothetical protein
MKRQPKSPECEKLASVSEDSNKIGEFLAWLAREKHVELAQWHGDELILHNSYSLAEWSINKMLADYFDIDMKEVERERRILLEWLREVQS